MASPPRNFSLIRPDGTLKSAEELQEDADRLVRDARARAERMRTEIAGNVAEASSHNQAATVSVTASGSLRAVRLTDRVKGMGPAMIADSIMEAYEEATRRAVARTAEIAPHGMDENWRDQP